MPYMLLTDSVNIGCTVKLEFDIKLIYNKCGSNAVFPITYGHKPLIIIAFLIIMWLSDCMYFLTFILEVIEAFLLLGVLFGWGGFLLLGILVSQPWVTLFTLVDELERETLSVNSFTCLLDCSNALQIFTTLSTVRLSSLRRNSCRFSVTVKTILYLNIRSFTWKLQADAQVLSSVRSLSKGSW